MNILVRNLPRELTGEKLSGIFQPFGIIKSCTIIIDEATGRSKGFGFVDMPNEAEAKAAIKALNSKLISNAKIRVKVGGPPPKPYKKRPASPKTDRFDAGEKRNIRRGKPGSIRSSRGKRP